MKTKKRRVRKNKKAKQDEIKTKNNEAVKKVKKGKIVLCKICNLKMIQHQIHSCRPESDSLVIQCALCDRRFKCKKYMSMHTVMKHMPRSLLKLSLFRLRKLIQPPSKKNLKSKCLVNEIAENQVSVNILDDAKLMSYKCIHCTRYYEYEKDLANHTNSEHTDGPSSSTMINEDEIEDQMKPNNDSNLNHSSNGPSTSLTMINDDENNDQMKQNNDYNLNHSSNEPSTSSSMINEDQIKDQMKPNNDYNLNHSSNGPSTSLTMINDDENNDQMKQNNDYNLNHDSDLQTTNQDDNDLLQQNFTVNAMRKSEYKEKSDDNHVEINPPHDNAIIILDSPMHSPNPNQTENVATEVSQQMLNDWPENITVHERSDETLSLCRTECIVCNQYFLHYEELVRHMKTDHIRHVCLICKRTFTMRYQLDATMKTKKRRVRKNKKAKQDEIKTKNNEAVKKVKKGKIVLCKICNLKMIQHQIHSCRPESDSLVIQCALCDRRFKCKKYMSMHTVMKHMPRSLLKLSLFRLRKLIQPPSKKNLKSKCLVNEIAENQVSVNILDDAKLMSYKCIHCTRYYEYEKDLANHTNSEHTDGPSSSTMINEDEIEDQMKPNNDSNLNHSSNGPSTSLTMINDDENNDQMKQNNDYNLNHSSNEPSTSSSMINEDQIKDQMKPNNDYNLNHSSNGPSTSLTMINDDENNDQMKQNNDYNLNHDSDLQTTNQDDNDLLQQNFTVNAMRKSEYKEKSDDNHVEINPPHDNAIIILDSPMHSPNPNQTENVATEVSQQMLNDWPENITVHERSDETLSLCRTECIVCNQYFLHYEELVRHMKTDHIRHVCLICKRTFTMRYQLFQHMSWIHNVTIIQNKRRQSNYKNNPNYKYADVKVEPSWSGGSNVKVGPSWSDGLNVKVEPSWPVVKVEPKVEIDDY